MTKNALTYCLFVCVLLLANSSTRAQPPLQFSSTTEALLLYEAGMLDTLRERCKQVKSDGLASREELMAVKNGFSFTQEQMSPAGNYRVTAFDQDKRMFVLIEGQTLAPGVRLTLRLALPRDYTRCRLVSSPAGQEQLEVVSFEKNYPAEVRNAQGLLKVAGELSISETPVPVKEYLLSSDTPAVQSLGAACTMNKESIKLAGQNVFIVDGKKLMLPPCGAAVQALHLRMNRFVRKVFER